MVEPGLKAKPMLGLEQETEPSLKWPQAVRRWIV